jgi:hypothetical protein
MLGKYSGLDGGEPPYLYDVGWDSSYGFLALHRTELFRDGDFAELYCSDNGRPSVLPSLLATACCSRSTTEYRTRRPRRGRTSTCARRWRRA